MRVLTWNVNGLKAAVAKAGSLLAVLEALQADIICLQETKLQRKELQRDVALAEGWESFFSFCSVKTGYSGVATFCRKATVGVPLAAEEGLTGAASMSAPSSSSGDGGGSLGSSSGSISSASTPVLLQDELGLGLEQLQAVDAEGRALVTDHGAFLLVNLYGPALTSADSLAERLAYKLDFYKVLEWRLRQWAGAGRAVVVVGDLNISPFPIDSCDGANMDMGRPDRVWLQRLLGAGGPGVTDAFRRFHPDRPQAYTCWNTASGARQLNWGTRIDHILVAGPAPADLLLAASRGSTAAMPSSHHSSSTLGSLGTPAPAAGAPTAAAAAAAGPCLLIEFSRGAGIMSDHPGSDHAPVWADLDIPRHCFATPTCLPALASSRIFPGRNMSLKGWLQQQQDPQQQQQQQKPQQEQEPQQEQQQEKAQQQPAKRPRIDSKTSSRGSQGSNGSSSKSGGKSQPSLLGFMGFQRLKPPTPAAPAAAAAQASQQQDQQQPLGGLEQSQQREVQPEPPQEQQQQHMLDPEVQQALDSKHQETVAAWQRISQRLQPPLCSGHREPSVIRTVKKAGANAGRQFYCCARTAGPPPQGRCSFFVWANAQRTVKGAPAAAAAAAAAPRSQ